MITVMQVCGAKGPGGAESHFLRFCLALAETGHFRVIPVVRRGSWLEEQLGKHALPFRALPFTSRWDIRTRLGLRRIARQEQAQLAQCWMSRAASLMPRVKGVINIGRLGGYYALKNYRKMHWLVGATPDLVRHITESGFPTDHTINIPNFVNPPIAEDPATSAKLREQLGTVKRSVVFTPARLHPVKGLDTAIQAMTELPEDVIYIIAGAGPEQDNLKQLISQLNLESRVFLVGWTNNISQYCHISDIFLVPSRHEPFGSVLLEAWSHHLPLLSSNSEGASAILSHEDTALIFEKDNPQDLSGQLSRLLNDAALRQRLVSAGTEELEAHYTATRVIGRYTEFYRQLSHTR